MLAGDGRYGVYAMLDNLLEFLQVDRVTAISVERRHLAGLREESA